MSVSRFRAQTDLGPRRHAQPPNPMLRVVIPYTPARLEPRTRAWGEANGAEFVDVSADVEAYWRLLRELWVAGDSFVLVEHDVLPPPGAIEGMTECADELCLHPYPDSMASKIWEFHLGCTRFGAELLAQFPDLVDETQGEPGPPGLTSRFTRQGPRGWLLLSKRLEVCLERRGVRHHRHTPTVDHLHPLDDLVRRVGEDLVDVVRTLRATPRGDGGHLGALAAALT